MNNNANVLTPDLYRKLVVHLVNYFDEFDYEFLRDVIERLSKVPFGTEFEADPSKLPEGLASDDDLDALSDAVFVGFQVLEWGWQ